MSYALCLKKSFVKPVLYQLLAHAPHEPVCCVTGLFPLSVFTLCMSWQAWCLLKQLLWKALSSWNVPYGTVSCSCGIFVIALVVLYFHYLNICNFRIHCNEESRLVIHVVRWKLSGLFWFPVCPWEVPELSGVWRVGGRTKFTHLVSSCWYIHESLSPNPG